MGIWLWLFPEYSREEYSRTNTRKTMQRENYN